jgi:hypothetical protein
MTQGRTPGLAGKPQEVIAETSPDRLHGSDEPERSQENAKSEYNDAIERTH